MSTSTSGGSSCALLLTPDRAGGSWIELRRPEVREPLFFCRGASALDLEFFGFGPVFPFKKLAGETSGGGREGAGLHRAE